MLLNLGLKYNDFSTAFEKQFILELFTRTCGDFLTWVLYSTKEYMEISNRFWCLMKIINIINYHYQQIHRY